MSVSIDIYSLKKFDEITNEVILADFVFGGIKFFHEIDEGGEFQSFGVELEFSLENLHVFMREHRHHPFNILPVVPLFLEDLFIEI